MLHRIRATVAGIALVGAAAVSIAIAPTASATPDPATPVAAPELTFALPAISGPNVGPGYVGGGLFRQTLVTARPAAGSSVSFAVANLAHYNTFYAYQYVQVAWRNLTTGATGTVNLRHWQRPNFAPGTIPLTGYPSTLPTTASAPTGAGPVVATVTVLREQYSGTVANNIIPGLNALLVP
ncbi:MULTISPECIES: hypothetical protein [Gordonia]|uniref:hypothetical protein n=1 Tax=Gordonia TaxID=2053 RepID=UPI00339904B7